VSGAPAIRAGSAATADGRRLAYRDAGDPAGIAVVSHHGTPGSRLERHPDDERLMAELGLRVITYDRPGYGGSDPHPGRRVADAAADVAALADHLGLARFAVVGESGGGPHALACSAGLGERVLRVGVVVGSAPADDPDFDFLAGMGQLNLDEFAAAAESEAALTAYLEPICAEFRRDPDAMLDAIAAGTRELVLATGLEHDIVTLRRRDPDALFDQMSMLVKAGYAQSMAADGGKS